MAHTPVPFIQFQAPSLRKKEKGKSLLGKAFNVAKGAAVGFATGGPIGAAIGGGATLAGELIPGASQSVSLVDAIGGRGPGGAGGASPLKAGPGAADVFETSVGSLFPTVPPIGQFRTSGPIEDAITRNIRIGQFRR